MGQPEEVRGAEHGGGESTDRAASLAKTVLGSGMSALLTAQAGAKTGAKLAVGTLFAGCNVLLDLGVRVTRRLPLEDEEAGVHLETAGGEIPVVVRQSGRLPGGAAALGWWVPGDEPVQVGEEAVGQALRRVRRSVYVVDRDGEVAVGVGGRAVLGADTVGVDPSYPVRAFVPALGPEALGDPAFRETHRVRYAYVAGAMANGIASEEMVEAMARAGMLAFFGAAGLSLERIETAIDRLQRNLSQGGTEDAENPSFAGNGDAPFGFNLIHSPNEPELEAATVDLYLRRGVRLVSASAYLGLTLPLVRYRVSGIHRDAVGRIVCPNHVMAKVSRVEVAQRFFSPPPGPLLQALVESGDITEEQAALARSVPMAEDLTAEADSGGHTDNRSAVALIPTMIALRDEMQAEHQYAQPIRVGAAGGIATPSSMAAMFGMGAAYVLTGSINQACVEAGTSRTVREMLAQARQADVTMA
ncbi:MAG: hypothetical protein JXQ75_21105, partial [Phycisphaerae bacterium]|nr:hypothetical protein [Phycisphaerae bacterium]